MRRPAPPHRLVRAAAVLVAGGAALLLGGLPVAVAATADTGGSAGAQPAASGADWSVTSPAAGSTVTTDADVAIAVTCPQAGCGNPTPTVTVSDPRAGASDASCTSMTPATTVKTDDAGNPYLSAMLALAHPYGNSCGPLAGAPGYNGTWSIAVTDAQGQRLNGSTFIVKAAPAAPAAPSATSTSSGVNLSWPSNPEPDTFAYAVSVDGKYSGTSAPCSFGTATCTATVSVPSGQHSITLVAARHTSPGSQDYVTGPTGAATTVTVAEPSPSPSPSARPTASTHPSATPTGNVALPSSVRFPSGTGPGLNGDFFHNNPLGSLPPLTTHGAPRGVATPSALAAEDEGPDGPYGKLNYGDQSIVTSSEHQVDAGGVIGNLASALGVSAVTAASCVSGGLLALLGALHLALWTRRAPMS